MPGVERGYAGMRVRRAQHIAARFVRLPNVVDVAAPAFEKAQILLPAYRLPDGLHAHITTPSFS